MSLPGQCDCPAGSFITGNLCSVCTRNCAECLTASACGTCAFGLSLLQGVCLSVCPLDYYAFRGQCISCTTDCPTPVSFSVRSITQQDNSLVVDVKVTGVIPAEVRDEFTLETMAIYLEKINGEQIQG